MMTLLVFPTRHTIQDQSTNGFHFDIGVPFPNTYIYINYANLLVYHWNLSETVWYPTDLSERSNSSDNPELRESRSDHPEFSASPIFEGGHLPGHKHGILWQRYGFSVEDWKRTSAQIITIVINIRKWILDLDLRLWFNDWQVQQYVSTRCRWSYCVFNARKSVPNPIVICHPISFWKVKVIPSDTQWSSYFLYMSHIDCNVGLFENMWTLRFEYTRSIDLSELMCTCHPNWHDDVIKWKHFPRYWPFVRGIHRSRWIPHTKASDAELWCFLWSTPE